jgi:hypothetical protein
MVALAASPVLRFPTPPRPVVCTTFEGSRERERDFEFEMFPIPPRPEECYKAAASAENETASKMGQRVGTYRASFKNFVGVTDDFALVCDGVARSRDITGWRADVPYTTTAHRHKLERECETELRV